MSKIAFYDSYAWRQLRAEIKRLDHNECVLCRERKHRHVPADLVHHVWHLDEFPQYGLSPYVRDSATGKLERNLISVCRECHETICHPERLRAPYEPRSEPLTPERW